MVRCFKVLKTDEMRRNIAFIVQRYGNEINGGAEVHCRQLAERLSATNQVEVLTTCAIDYHTWRPELPEGETFVNGIKVIRFASKERNKKLARKSGYALSSPTYLIKHGRLLSLARSIMPKWKNGEIWLKAQGPYCEDLITYLEKNHKKYDVLIFMTYLYYPTAVGIRVAPQKSILIPTAHDERPIYFFPYKQVFNLPAFIMYNSKTEKTFVETHFHNQNIPNEIAGVGIEPPDPKINFPKERFGITGDYILFVGRIASEKVVNLFEDFIEYKKKYPSNLKLILIGQAFIEIPQHSDIIYLGFVSDDMKNSAMKSALMLVLPSHFESLSMVVLESLYFNTPILVNGQCEILVEHCKQSGAGFYYNNKNEFDAAIEFARANNDKLIEMGVSGKKYVIENYSWNAVIEKYQKAFDIITQTSPYQ